MFPLNAVAPLNALPMFVTLATFQEFKSWLSQIKRDHYDSSHVCWAYALHREQSIDYHCSDGGEPSGTAGKPILSTIKTNNLIQTGVIVVRYFGGVKLGVGGLINAYRSAAQDALLNIAFEKRYIKEVFVVHTLLKENGIS